MKPIPLLFMLLWGLQASAQTLKIKIACIGNSITYGSGIPDRQNDSYPGQLQTLLGNNYQVDNYGVSGATLLKNGNNPYIQTQAYKNALAGKPDIVFVKLGTNDSKSVNRIHLDDFESDYHDLIKSFARLSSKPRIILLLPAPSFNTDTLQIWDSVISRQIIPHIQQVAYQERIEVINLYSLLIDRPDLFPDKIHPDAAGATIIANRLFELLLNYRDMSFDVFNKIDVQKSISSFYGYPCADFSFGGRSCKIVKPKWAAKDHPWVWRARFWGHEPQADIALLERGFHIVYCDVAELYGNKESIALWNNYYTLLTRSGLSPKAVLEGMSRGGVYAYNWAAENPDKVACVYADNPVLDLKSWPGGKGKGPGSKPDWEVFKTDFGIKSDEEAESFSGSPINKTEAIVKGKYPMLHVCADADEVVPAEENTIPFVQKIKTLGGNITVIYKRGFKHHPHSLPNPTPIVDFILKATDQVQQ